MKKQTQKKKMTDKKEEKKNNSVTHVKTTKSNVHQTKKKLKRKRNKLFAA